MERGEATANLVHKIREFGGLTAGWNSHRAPGISTDAIKAAVDIVLALSGHDAPLPVASPTPLGGVALTWLLPRIEVQLLLDDDSIDYSVARRGSPKIIAHGGIPFGQETKVIDRLLHEYALQ